MTLTPKTEIKRVFAWEYNGRATSSRPMHVRCRAFVAANESSPTTRQYMACASAVMCMGPSTVNTFSPPVYLRKATPTENFWRC